MLLVHRVAEDGHRYYLDAVAPTGGAAPARGEAPGRWVGAGRSLLGLQGTVDGLALARLLAGRHPEDEGPVVVRRAGRVAGLDLLFAAPKSVSLVHGLADRSLADGLATAHDRAVDAAIGYLERQACVVRQGQLRRAPGSGLVGAAFRHRTSRADDPHLHTHVLTANLSAGPSGRWSALHTPPLFAELRTAGALYQAVLRHEIACLGLAWVAADGRWELCGVTRPVIDAFSHRRAQLVERLADERRLTGAAGPASAAARLTRPPKLGLVDYEVLVESWRQRAARLEIELPRPGAPAHVLAPDPGSALESLGDVYGRSETVRAWCGRLPHGAPAAVVEALADETLRSSSVVPLPVVAGIGRRDGPSGPRPQFTSVAVVERRAQLLAGPPVPVVVGRWLERIDVLDRLRAAADIAGRTIVGAAPGLTAAVDLEAATGIAAAPIIQGERLAHSLPPGALLVVGGAERVATAELAALVDGARAAGADVVLAGDTSRRGTRLSAFALLADGSASLEVTEPTPPNAVATVATANGTLTAATSARLARQTMVVDWAGALAQGRHAVMVGRHPDEVEALGVLAGSAGAAVLAGDAWRHGRADQLVLGSRIPFRGRASASPAHTYVVAWPLSVTRTAADRYACPPSNVDLRRASLGVLDGQACLVAGGLSSNAALLPTQAGLRAAALVRAAEQTAAPWLADLGSPPTDALARIRWRQAVAAVVVYRDRWRVHDRQAALGDEPSSLAQRLDRRRAVEEIGGRLPDRVAALTGPGPGLWR